MPPISSLPLRDGRVGLPRTSPSYSSSSQLGGDDDDDGDQQRDHQHHHQHQLAPNNNNNYNNNNEPYYTDAEIELLNEIVTLGESILPTLPEQNRLPTEALFSAAEEILPKHGFDPDQPPPHISRFIFKIGGQRSGETLGDKFRTVLEGMGVELEIVPTSPAGSTSVRSRRSSVASRRRGSDPAAAPSTFWPEQVPRRRHSSTLTRPAIGQLPRHGEGREFDLPIRSALGTGASGRPRALSLSDYDSDAALEHALLRTDGGRSEAAQRVQEQRFAPQELASEENNRPVNPVLRTTSAPAHITTDSLFDEEVAQAESTPDLPILPFQAHVPIMERNRKPPSSFNFVQVGGDLSEPEGRDASTVGDTEHVHPSPDTEGSGVLGASEPSEQTRDDTPYSPRHGQPDLAPEDLQLLEGKAHQFRVQDGQKLRRQCLHNWRFNAIITRRDRGILELRAGDWDDEDIFDEVLGIWREEALASQQAKVAAQIAAEHEACVAKMERRAQRVYEILTVGNTLSHWHEFAMDEVERTAVARRHLVRKRAFDGWRAQHIEDETKVQNFVLIHALQKWTQIMLHHEVRKQVSVQRHERTLAQSVISTMYEENKTRVADECFYFKLGQHCLGTWFARTREVQNEMEVAAAGDNRLVLYEVVDIWREEWEELQYKAYDGTMQFLAKSCLRDLASWHEQARLKRTLRQCITNQVFASRNNVLSVWHHAAVQRQTKSRLAESTLLRGPLVHWQLQTKLQIFQSVQAQRTKSTVLKQWYLEERLAFFKRHVEHQTAVSTLNTLQTLTRQSRNNRARARQEADAEYGYFSKLEVVEKWLSKAAESWKPRHNANLVYLYRTTMPVMEVWREKLRFCATKSAHEKVKADVQARRAILGSVLSLWPALAERKRRERLLGALREFRRGYKIDLAGGCLDFWWGSTREILGRLGRGAEELLVRNKTDEVAGWIEHWAERAQEQLVVAEIAADAEVEVWCGVWQGRMEEMEELRGLAVNVDEEAVLRACWDRLEFQSLQRRVMARSVAAVREKNDLRFCGRVLEEWLEVAVPERGGDEMTFHGAGGEMSNLWSSRRGPGLRTPAGARSTSVLPTGRGGYNDNRNVFTPAASLAAGGGGGGGGGGGAYQRGGLGGGRATTTAHRVYTTTVGSNNNNNNNNTFETPGQSTAPPPPLLPSVSQLGGTAPAQQPRTRLPRTAASTTTRPLAFGTSASFLGPSTTPAQPPPQLQPRPATTPAIPMPSFDFDNLNPNNMNQAEDSLLLSLTGRHARRNFEEEEQEDLYIEDEDDDDLDLDQPPDLGFMSTPSRRLVRPGGRASSSADAATARNLAFDRVAALGGGGGGPTTTTTPSAVLASPFERELRRAYGRGGQGQGQTRGAAGSETGRGAQSQSQSHTQSLSIGPGTLVGTGTGPQGLGLALGHMQGQTRSVGPGPVPAFGSGLGLGTNTDTGTGTGLRSSLRVSTSERTTETPHTAARGGSAAAGAGAAGGRAGRVVEFADIREESAEF